MTGDGSSPTRTAVTRRRVLQAVGGGTGVAALGGWSLAGTAAAHDLEVAFPSCREVLVVVNDRSEFGVLTETIRVFDADSGKVQSVDVEITRENTRLVRDRFGDRPVFRYTASGDDAVVAVRTGDGRRFENPNDCPRPGTPADGGFALEQGDRCIPLTPLSYDGMPIEEFYGSPPDPKRSDTPTDLERPRTSLLFLYRGPSALGGPSGRDPDRVGLVVIHGASGGPGGAASFTLEGGPDPGPTVFDDDAAPDGSEDYLACGGAGECVANWAWDDGNDGAVWHPLNAEFSVRITPRFNEAASLDPPSGGVERWQVLSGDARSPDRTDLALDRPVTLRSGGC